MKFHKIISCLFFLVPFGLSSQNMGLEWSKKVGSMSTTIIGGAEPFVVVEDNIGSIVTAGRFNGPVDFNPGTPVFSMSTTGLVGFVFKLDSSGVFKWAKKLDEVYITGIEVDEQNNILITGTFEGTIDLDPSSNIHNLTALNFGTDIFILKLDSNGIFVWAKQCKTISNSSTIFSQNVHDIIIGDSSNIYLTGTFSGNVNFDFGFGTNNLTAVGIYDNVFVMSILSNGTLNWVKQYSGSNNVRSSAISLDDSSNVVIGGSFYGLLEYGPDSVSIGLGSVFGQNNGFMSKLNFNGSHIWTKAFISQNGSYTDLVPELIATDHFGNIVLSGKLNGTMDFDSDTSIVLLAGNSAIYVAKYDPLGNYIWVKGFGSYQNFNGSCWPVDLEIDKNNGILCLGESGRNTDFDPDTSSFIIDREAVYINKLNPNGKFEWVKPIKVLPTNPMQIRTWAFDYSESGKIITVGEFEGLVDFDPNIGEDLATSSGSDVLFVQKLRACANSDTIISVSECEFFTSPSGRHQWTESGIYLDTIPNYSGCDSIITLNLTIDTNTRSFVTIQICEGESFLSPSGNNRWDSVGVYYDTISNSNGCDSIIEFNINKIMVNISLIIGGFGETLLASANSATFRWLDCNNNFIPIDGEISSAFSAIQNGAYAVEVTQNGCIDTSDCFSINNVGLLESSFKGQIEFFPNPFQDYLHLEFGDFHETVDISILNVQGQLLFESNLSKTQKTRMDLSQLPGGLYYLRIKNTKDVYRFQIVKQN